jgi:hypothetical protein
MPVWDASPVSDEGLAELVGIACHDLRTPLATVATAARLLVGEGVLPPRESELAGLVEGAADEMRLLVEQLGLAARIASGRYSPELRDADTSELVRSNDARVVVSGAGELVPTDPAAATAALAWLTAAVLRHGGGAEVGWTVRGRSLTLAPLSQEVAAVIDGAADLGVLVARRVLLALGATISVAGDALTIELA